MSKIKKDNIKVHILNFHSIYSHIEIALENTSTHPHTWYGINRWAIPRSAWSLNGAKQLPELASSIYTFDITADPDEITKSWQKYWSDTQNIANPLGENCAVATQWFLKKFAGIPEPDLSNVSWNHLALGIIWPSFIPSPVTLPGRIMSNAKFHIEAKNHPEIANQYSTLFLYASMAVATLVISASIFALAVAATLLSGGIAAVAITACVAVGLASSYGFFKAHNIISAQNISGDLSKTDDRLPSLQDDPSLYQVNFSAG